MAKASEFVTARNASSSPKSAPDHGAETVVVDVDVDVDDDDDDDGDDDGDGSDVDDDGDVPLGRGVWVGSAIVAAVVPSVVGKVVDVLDGWLRHAVSTPPSAAPPTERMKVRREYTTNVYPRLIRSACEARGPTAALVQRRAAAMFVRAARRARTSRIG
jgi:hypothetical protein